MDAREECILNPKLSVVVLNYNGKKDTMECLDSLIASTYRPLELVIVDNASTDGSVDAFREWSKLRGRPLLADLDLSRDTLKAPPFEDGSIAIIQTGKNGGFGVGNNRGIEFALASGADLVMVLNNDTLVQQDALAILVAALERDPAAALVFPKVVGREGELQVPVYLRPAETFFELLVTMNLLGAVSARFRPHAYFERRNPFPGYAYDRPLVVPNVVSAVTVFRREFLEEHGAFDEAMFMYYEEDVLARKLRGSRWHSLFEPAATIVHTGGVGNAALPGPFLYVKRCTSEMHYLRRHMRLAYPGRLAIKLIRVGLYFNAMRVRPDYRAHWKTFWTEYVRR